MPSNKAACWPAVTPHSVWNLLGVKINIRDKWPGILGLLGLEIIIRPSLFDWGGGLGLSPGYLPFIMAGSVSLAWSLPVLWVFPLALLPLTLFKSDQTSAKLVYSCRQTPTSLAATNTRTPLALLGVKSVTTESLRTSAPCQGLADPPERREKYFD